LSVQKRVLRYIYNDYVSSYAELWEKGNKPLLYVDRITLTLVEVYKIVKYLHKMVVVHDSAYDMRNSMNIVMPKCNTVKYHKNYISYTGAKLWNILNNETKQRRLEDLLFYGMDQHVHCFNCTHCSLKCMYLFKGFNTIFIKI